MRLFAEIEKLLGARDASRVQYTVLHGRGGYFQNVKRVIEFSPSALIFSGKNGRVRVVGEELSIAKYYEGDAVVLGKIFRVEGDAEEKKE